MKQLDTKEIFLDAIDAKISDFNEFLSNFKLVTKDPKPIMNR